MATQLQLRHMDTATRTAYTPLVGEALWDTTTNVLYIGDGSTVGGVEAIPSTEIVSRVASGSAVSLTTATPANVTNISLPVGIWEVFGAVGFSEGASTVTTEQVAAINTVSATLPTWPAAGVSMARQSGTATTGDGSILPTSPCRITVTSGTTTVYLVAQATFTTSTNAAYGEIRAVRVG